MIRFSLTRWPIQTGIFLAVGLFLALLEPSSAATNCARPIVTSEMKAELPAYSIDQSLFSVAVLGQVNYKRCQQGLQQILGHNGLTDVATIHALWMAAEKQLSHHSTVIGQSDVNARVMSAIATPSVGSENIGYVHRFRIDEGEVFFTGTKACTFKTRAGRQIEMHSYASMAQRIVELWLASPGHRQNVLDGRISLTGSALAFDASAKYCGVYYMSQEFAG